jgi:Protein of unknown function (DUF3592)
MKGKIGLSLFGLPFFAVGLWMLWSIGSAVLDARAMQSWQAVSAQLIAAGYRTNRGDDSNTYEAYASYTYTVNGASYTGQRVGISSGSDNIGDYQTRQGDRLRNALTSGAPITVYVNPDDPADAIIDRELRWGLLGFKSIFLFVFGGVGLAMLIFAWRMQPAASTDSETLTRTPWLQNPEWTGAAIRSGSRASMWGAIAFAALWNLISAPLPFLVWREVLEKDNKPALLGLLFPAIGIMLILWALRRVREWRRFGPALLTPDPFPGSIGGHVGGTIDLDQPFDPGQEYAVSLSCLQSYVSGSGKNRSRRETAKWQDSTLAHAEPGGKGTRLSFRFAVPPDLPESDALRTEDSYHLWRLNLSADLPGTDLDRDYDIPVYATAQTSRSLSAKAMEQAAERQQGHAEERIRKLFRFEQTASGKRLTFPMGQQFGAVLGGVLIGSAFAIGGWFLMFSADAPLFGIIFGGVGSLIALASLYMLLKSLEVYQQGTAIVSVRRVLGLPFLRRRMERSQFGRFRKHASLQTQSGGKHVMHYSLYAVDKVGNEMLVGEGFRGESDTRAAMNFIAREFGVQPPAKEQQRQVTRPAESVDSNVLTEDS